LRAFFIGEMKKPDYRVVSAGGMEWKGSKVILHPLVELEHRLQDHTEWYMVLLLEVLHIHAGYYQK
jgi:hypothetical protein